jgi:hypothetical protein
VQRGALVLVERVHLDAAVEEPGDDLDLAVRGRRTGCRRCPRA